MFVLLYQSSLRCESFCVFPRHSSRSCFSLSVTSPLVCITALLPHINLSLLSAPFSVSESLLLLSLAGYKCISTQTHSIILNMFSLSLFALSERSFCLLPYLLSLSIFLSGVIPLLPPQTMPPAYHRQAPASSHLLSLSLFHLLPPPPLLVLSLPPLLLALAPFLWVGGTLSATHGVTLILHSSQLKRSWMSTRK